MQLSFDVPWEVWAVERTKDSVGHVRVDVFAVDEEAINVKETGANMGKRAAGVSIIQGMKWGSGDSTSKTLFVRR